MLAICNLRRSLQGLMLALAPAVIATAGADTTAWIGADRCGECHAPEVAAWQASAHQRGYFEMHRKPAAKAIAAALGVRRIKRAERCMTCHYSPAVGTKTPKAARGVSCESCHGPARAWLDAHSDYGPDTATRASETAEHAATRQAISRAAGMNARFSLDRLVARCFECHVIADPELVAAGHPASSELEMVAWSQGEVRHNYFFSPDKLNRDPNAAHKRKLWTIGQVQALARALSAIVDADRAGPYRDAMTATVQATHDALAAAPGGDELVAEARDVAASALADPAADPAALAARARAIATHLHRRGADTLPAALDTALPAPATYRGEARP